MNYPSESEQSKDIPSNSASPTLNESNEQNLSNNSRIEELRRQIDEVKARLAIYEEENPDRKAQNIAKDRARVRKVFDMFDADHSGTIDANEFQDLAYQLGEVLTIEEVEEYIRKIDLDQDGTVDFEEFFRWWTSTTTTTNDHFDHRDSGNFNLTSSYERNQKFRVLKMKLQSKAYLRAISGLSKAFMKARATRQTNFSEISSNNNESDTIKVDDSSTTVMFEIQVGDLKEIHSSIHFTYHNEIEKANQLRKDVIKDILTHQLETINTNNKNNTNNHHQQQQQHSESPVVFSVSLVVKRGVNQFALGELNSHLKNSLLLLKDVLHFNDFKSSIVDDIENDRQLYRFALFYSEPHLSQSAVELLEMINCKFLDFSVQFGSTPSRYNADVPQFKMDFKGQAPRASIDIIHELITKEFGGNPMKSPTLTESASVSLVEKLLSQLIFSKLTLHFSDLNSFLKEASIQLRSNTVWNLTEGWVGFRRWLTPIFQSVLFDTEMPPVMTDTYFSVLDTIEGLDSASLIVHNHAFEAKAVNIHFPSVIPSKNDMNATV